MFNVETLAAVLGRPVDAGEAVSETVSLPSARLFEHGGRHDCAERRARVAAGDCGVDELEREYVPWWDTDVGQPFWLSHPPNSE